MQTASLLSLAFVLSTLLACSSSEISSGTALPITTTSQSTGSATCPAGHCQEQCPAGESCTSSCAGGGCEQICAAGATCIYSCAGGGCDQVCASAANCTFTCAGSGCDSH